MNQLVLKCVVQHCLRRERLVGQGRAVRERHSEVTRGQTDSLLPVLLLVEISVLIVIQVPAVLAAVPVVNAYVVIK